ncbi:uncharacterized protein [Battus philenor]|uniref:uncharacterized protein n=1 Tax=Battus philenor TaxID=42288 RepID=UPI0035CEE535
MIPYHFQIYASVSFYFLCKILCTLLSYISMLDTKHRTLMSDSGKEETDEEVCKWIPKKKHEVLKAKYKCLKKLFQIYDASVIGILPEAHAVSEKREERRHCRRRRTHRAKADAGTEVSCGTVLLPIEKRSITTSVIRDLKLQYATSVPDSLSRRDKFTQDSKDFLSITTSEKECECTQTSELLQMPFLIVKDSQPKPTRFQMFLQRILGIRREKPSCVLPNPHVYAASDNNISNRYEKRRRRGLRFRRLRNTKKIHSETALREGQSPVILTYVQSVQKNCLMDTTPRQCPFVGCRTIFYGIINYNDHLNLCHFTDRKYCCHYCHEGFMKERDKLVHENEHIGISKLNTNLIPVPNSSRHSKVASITQTDPEPKDVNEEKLKKIVSFFDKIDDPEEILAELKKSRHSASNVNLTRHSSKTETVISGHNKSISNSRKSSCAHLQKAERKSVSSADSVVSERSMESSIKCQMCGENFDHIQRLNLHVSTEHRIRNRNTKCQNREVTAPQRYQDSEDEDQGSVKNTDRSYSTVRPVDTSSVISQSTSEERTARSESYDPSTNIIYYSSMESVQRPSNINNQVKRVRSGFNSYKWEPGTKVM